MARTRTIFRRLDGILLLDKPAGLSSNQALQRVRHLFRAEKGGHTGALDPLATGLLPLCFGEATKIAGLLLGGRKAYEAGIVLGTVTDTDDADGLVLRERPVPALDIAQVTAALQPFLGTIAQRPPIYSALKQGGEPLYAKARRGEAIAVPERAVHIERIDILALEGAHLRLRVECGSGTYIRSLARDLGEVLGCGGHIASLRRTWVEPFFTPDMVTPDALQALADDAGEAALLARLLPLDAGLAGFPAALLDDDRARRFCLGQVVAVAGMAATDTVNAVGPDGLSLGLARLDAAGHLHPRRLFVRQQTVPA